MTVPRRELTCECRGEQRKIRDKPDRSTGLRDRNDRVRPTYPVKLARCHGHISKWDVLEDLRAQHDVELRVGTWKLADIADPIDVELRIEIDRRDLNSSLLEHVAHETTSDANFQTGRGAERENLVNLMPVRDEPTLVAVIAPPVVVIGANLYLRTLPWHLATLAQPPRVPRPFASCLGFQPNAQPPAERRDLREHKLDQPWLTEHNIAYSMRAHADVLFVDPARALPRRFDAAQRNRLYGPRFNT